MGHVTPHGKVAIASFLKRRKTVLASYSSRSSVYCRVIFVSKVIHTHLQLCVPQIISAWPMSSLYVSYLHVGPVYILVTFIFCSRQRCHWGKPQYYMVVLVPAPSRLFGLRGWAAWLSGLSRQSGPGKNPLENKWQSKATNITLNTWCSPVWSGLVRSGLHGLVLPLALHVLPIPSPQAQQTKVNRLYLAIQLNSQRRWPWNSFWCFHRYQTHWGCDITSLSATSYQHVWCHQHTSMT